MTEDASTSTAAETIPAGFKRCAGYAKWGIQPHLAPVDQFQKAASQKDGLDRTCRPHVAEYTRLIKAAKGDGNGGEGGSEAKPKAAKVPKAKAAKADKAVTEKAPRQRKSAKPVPAVEELPQTPAEVETPDGQQALADAATAAADARKAAEREAARVRMANLRAARKAADASTAETGASVQQ